jgi:phosphoribosylformylglycinamidine synthase
MEVSATNVDFILAQFQAAGVPCHIVGKSVAAQTVTLSQNGVSIDLGSTSMTALRDTWESTSFALENLQTNPACVVQEKNGLATRMAPPFHLTYTMTPTTLDVLTSTSKPCVAILRDEGSNGDREMCSAFHAAGFETWDVHVRDLLSGSIRLDATNEKTGAPLFRGLVFVGGFSYADTLDSAKGWAGTILFNVSGWWWWWWKKWWYCCC